MNHDDDAANTATTSLWVGMVIILSSYSFIKTLHQNHGEPCFCVERIFSHTKASRATVWCV
jgi:hypothetical protein